MPALKAQMGIYLPCVTITAGGRPLASRAAYRLTQVSVTQRMDPPDQFSFDIYDPDLDLIDPATGTITEGTVIEISIGYSGKTSKLLTGRITALEAEFSADGPTLVHVDGFDLLHDLARGTAYRVFPGSEPGSGMPDSQIVDTLARDAALTPVVSATQPRRAPRVQRHVSDLTFARQLAALNGFSLWADGRTLHFEPERPAPGPAIELAWGKTLRSFTPRLSITGQVGGVEVRGWDPVQKQSFSYKSDGASNTPLSTSGRAAIQRGSGGDSILVVADAQVTSATEARALADRTLADQHQALITGEGTCVGEPQMRVGSLLSLTGIGRFSGTYTVTEVTHTVNASGYLTRFTVNSSAQVPGDLTAAPQADGLAYGMLPGIVTANADDQRRGQVEVRIPALDDQARLWARLGTLMAGPKRGTLFMPEVGDEVLVAFEQGDPGRPYVVGSLWNGQDAPPQPDEEGQGSGQGGGDNVRMIYSRSGHQILFDDTSGAETISIIGKGGDPKVTLDAAASKVTVHSAATIRLEAANIEIEASAGVTIKGETVKIN